MEMARIFSQVDLLLVPSLRDEMLTISNFTGHPSLDVAGGLRTGGGSAQRLGARSGAPSTQILAGAAGAAWSDADRTAVR